MLGSHRCTYQGVSVGRQNAMAFLDRCGDLATIPEHQRWTRDCWTKLVKLVGQIGELQVHKRLCLSLKKKKKVERTIGRHLMTTSAFVHACMSASTRAHAHIHMHIHMLIYMWANTPQVHMQRGGRRKSHQYPCPLYYDHRVWLIPWHQLIADGWGASADEWMSLFLSSKLGSPISSLSSF